MDDIRARAAAAGLSLVWTDAFGNGREVGDETLRAALAAIGEDQGGPAQAGLVTGVTGAPVRMSPGVSAGGSARVQLESGDRFDVRLFASGDDVFLPAIIESGYHRVEAAGREITLAIAPPRAFGLRDAIGERDAWGIAAQLYSLPPRRGASFGDLGALADCAGKLGRAGADALAISPTHALYAADPGSASPYAPSTRLFLNPLYADPHSVFADDFSDVADDPEPGDPLIDWSREGARKLAGLRRLYARFASKGPEGARADFARWRTERGGLLEDHATYEALQAHFAPSLGLRGWQGWPGSYRDPRSDAVRAFRAEHSEEIACHAFLQWLTERSLEAAQMRAQAAGMAIGIVADMAVGMDAGGSHAWSRPGDLLQGVSIGAPPDLLGPLGQDWGLTTFSPRSLATQSYAPFIETLRASMRSVGGVRIDHVMGLSRLWLVPWGRSSTDGVYLSYPLTDMLRLVALESWRNRAIVIGEDLGTVPDGFREILNGAGVMGMRVLYFERGHDGGFRAPAHYDRDAAALTTTHDLPTFAGWWRGRDLDWREKLALYPGADDASRAREGRSHDRGRFWDAAIACGAASGEAPDPSQPGRAVDAGIAYVAESACALALVPVEDIAGLDEQPNLPGVTEGHPNWRRRLPADFLDGEDARRRLERLAARRPRGEGGSSA
ncbi:MAG: 4-alpha-glucanotransferase [Salinarimonadaceae bacterium]|nr:MAG: 4-alpha-glucanotransferase [Salinarimonadaceae bacterium]